MKRISIILILALLLSTLSVSAVFAQSTSIVSTNQYHFVSPTNACGWGAHDGQVVHGKLYVSPGFNLRQWLKFNPSLTYSALLKLNPGLINGPQPACGVIILPSM